MKKEFTQIDQKAIELMTMHKALQPRNDIDYVSKMLRKTRSINDGMDASI